MDYRGGQNQSYSVQILQRKPGLVIDRNQGKIFEISKIYEISKKKKIQVVNDELVDKIKKKRYSSVRVRLAFKRNHQFYSLTLIVPIIHR